MGTVHGTSRQQTITVISLGSGPLQGESDGFVMAASPLALGPKRIRRVPPGIVHRPQASVQGERDHLSRSPWGFGSPFFIHLCLCNSSCGGLLGL